MTRILETLLQTAWAMEPAALEVMARIVIQHEAGIRLSKEEIEARIVAARNDGGTKASPGYQVIDGVAVIPVYGVIEKRAGFFSDMSGMVSTLAVQRDLNAALNDPNVSGILLDMDSPGGSVDGVAELGDAVFAARKKKPTYAYANGTMASAAYWIGSQAEKLFAGRAARVGSIGVYTVLYDYSQNAAAEGVKVHVVKAGAHKATGVGGTEITPTQLAETQRMINAWYDLFVTAVAVGRGLTESQAKELADGRVHLGEAAKGLGLVDGVASLEDVIQKLKPAAKASGSPRASGNDKSPQGAKTMTEEELRAGEKKRLADLKAAFPKDLAFAMEAAEQGWTVEQAKAKHHDALEAKLAAQEKQHADDLEKVKADAAKKTPAGLKPVGSGEQKSAGNGGGSAKAEFMAKVQEYTAKGMSKADATARVVKDHPDLHKAMLEEVNPGRAELVAAHCA